MDKKTYGLIENHMLDCMRDSAHDKEHIYRVLYAALDIAGSEENVDLDVLTAACLLHDIGREEQFKNPDVCHAEIGSRMAYDFLAGIGWAHGQADRVRLCILSHRYRNDAQPASLEAKILFDADKLDATGALGIARTLIYKGQVSDPLYTVDENGRVMDGADAGPSSFLHEYKFKLEKRYGLFYTRRGREIAQGRRDSAAAFYQSLLVQSRECRESGMRRLACLLCGKAGEEKA